MTRIANVALDGMKNDADRVFEWLRAIHPDERPDIVTIQKTGRKDLFPRSDLREIGYESCCPGGPRRYLGVAILSHCGLPSPEVVDCGLPHAAEGESRFLTVSIGGLWVSSVYVPYGPKEPGPEQAIARRVEWLNRLRGHVCSKGHNRRHSVLCGDFNVKFKADGRCDGPRRDPLFTAREQVALEALLDLGFVDLYRTTHPNTTEKPGRTRGYSKKHSEGTSRLHLMLASHSLARHPRDIWLDPDASRWPRRDAPPLVVDLEGLEV